MKSPRVPMTTPNGLSCPYCAPGSPDPVVHILALNSAQHFCRAWLYACPSSQHLKLLQGSYFSENHQGQFGELQIKSISHLGVSVKGLGGWGTQGERGCRSWNPQAPSQSPLTEGGSGPAQLRAGRTAPACWTQTPRGSELLGQARPGKVLGGHPSDPGARAEEELEKSRKTGAGKGAPFTG